MTKKNLLLSVLLFILVLASIAAGSYYYIQKQIEMPLDANSVQAREFTVEKGEGVKNISSDLEKSGIIRGAGYFQIYVWQEKIAEKIQAGKYELSSSMAIPEIADILMGGKIKDEDVWVTIPEGFLAADIDRRLAESGLIKEGDFLKMDSSNLIGSSQYDFLADKPEGATLEGYYFPDTYKFKKDVTTEEIAKKMLDNFGNKLSADLREEIKKQGKSIFEVIVLASIIEKEAGSKEDMGKVSSVFQNRLAAGKKLESDATVNYVIQKGRAQATYEDLEVESLYNTYKYAGLPPGPISNPGLDALKAAIYPEKTDYYYFLTKKEDGRAVFARTFDEHLLNKSKYLR